MSEGREMTPISCTTTTELLGESDRSNGRPFSRLLLGGLVGGRGVET